MSISVRNNITYCITGGRAVFMDMDRGRYFALPDAIDSHFRRLVAGEAFLGSDQEALDALIRNGIVTDGIGDGTQARPCPTIRRPRNDLADGGHTAPLGLRIQAVVAEMRAIYWIRKYAFGPLVARLASLRSRGRSADGHDDLLACGEIANALSKTSLIFPTRDRCLVRSIAFLQMALKRHADAHLVFGVSIDPFAAHCWVQSGDYVLNDRYERVRAFTPILSI
jgi:hypothetical protein